VEGRVLHKRLNPSVAPPNNGVGVAKINIAEQYK
jgi:hypothetical protein